MRSVAKYFMHLRNSTDELLDPEGVDLKDLEAVRQNVMAAARDILASDLRNGVVDLRFRIDAENDLGAVVYTLPFTHAFSIIPEAA
jgi:hypothetical protein